MKKLFVSVLLLVVVASTGIIHASSPTLLEPEEYYDYSFELMNEINSVEMNDVTLENFLKYGLDRTVEPFKNAIVQQQPLIENAIQDLNAIKVNDKVVDQKRVQLMNELDILNKNIAEIIKISDEIIVETSNIKSVNIILLDGLDALSGYMDTQDRIDMLFFE